MRWKTSWFSALLALAACSTGDWTRSDTPGEQTQADFLACDAAARAAPTVPRPRQGFGRNPGDPPDADHQLDIAQRVERCMRNRGYAYRPAR